jgi:hypothetical protein
MKRTKRSLLYSKLKAIQKGEVKTDYPVISKTEE